MRFYLKDGGGQLLVRRLSRAALSTPSATLSTSTSANPLEKADEDLPEDDPRWTSFPIPLRLPAPVPSPPDLVRFLTSSLTFMARLWSVSVILNGKLLAKVTKSVGEKRDLGVPRGLKITGIGEGGIIRINGVSETRKSFSFLNSQ
jgi:hypothetical protein